MHFKYHVFPDAHPKARKSQINIDNVDKYLYPLFDSTENSKLEIILKPGLISNFYCLL